MREPIQFYQTDPRWADIRYALNDEDTLEGEIATIGNSGCGPACMAMVISTLTEETVTPPELCKWAYDNDFKLMYQGTSYDYFEPQGSVYGIKVTMQEGESTYDSHTEEAKALREKMTEELNKGNWFIAVMGPSIWTSWGHYVLVWATDKNGYFYIKDPYNDHPACVKSFRDDFFPYVKHFWLVDVNKYIEDHPKRDEDDIVEKIKIKLFGEEFDNIDAIKKDGKIFVSPHIFERSGLVVESREDLSVNPSEVKVRVNGIPENVKRFLVKWTNYAPVRAIAEAMGEYVKWNQEEKLIIINTKTVKIRIDGEDMEIKGTFLADRNYVAIRALAEVLGYNVQWNDIDKSVIISKPKTVHIS